MNTLSRSEADWELLAVANFAVRTTLDALTVPIAVDLLEHAWVLTVAATVWPTTSATSCCYASSRP